MLPNAAFEQIALANRIAHILMPELRLALTHAQKGLAYARMPEQACLKTLVQAIQQINTALSNHPTPEHIKAEIHPLLNEACQFAMERALTARIPECGTFGMVAKSLCWARQALN